MNLNGRPSLYKPEIHPTLASFYAQEGMTEAQIAERFGISVTTLNHWKQQHSEFIAALKTTKIQVDAMVEQSLFQKAMKGDVTACIFWLKNRQPARWRDRQEVETTAITDVAVAVKKLLE